MITYQEEQFNDVIDEIKPLLEEHYHEVAMYKDRIELNPNYDLYEIMNRTGNVHIFTARDSEANNALVGYCLTFMQQHPHYKDHVYAVNDIIYVAEPYRHTEVAPEMISRLEKAMLAEGVSVMTFHMKTYKTFETLMDSLGFEQFEYLYSKYIKD